MGKSIEEQRKAIRAKKKSKEFHKERVQSNRYYTDSMFIRGIYKLYFNNKVVYVGMSKTNVISRITQHYSENTKFFDSFSFKSYDELSDKELEQKEADVIKKIKPKYNVVHNNNNNIKPKSNKYIKPPKSRFKNEIKSLKYSETIDGKMIFNK